MNPSRGGVNTMKTNSRGWGRYGLVRHCVSILMALGVLGLAAYYGSDLIEALRAVNLGLFFLGLAFYALNYFVRALRLLLLSQGRIPIWPQGLHATSLHGFATYMMPFRSGELTLPFVLRSVAGLSLTDGSRILIGARVLDVMTLGGWMILAALFAEIDLSSTKRFIWLGLGLTMSMAPLIVSWLGTTGRKSKIALLKWLGQFTMKTAIRWSEIAVSVGVWTAIGSCYFCAARAIGLPLSMLEVCLLISLQLLLQLIPVQGFANAGNHEGGWVAGLMLLGVSTQTAIEFALLSHALIILYVLTLGPAALLTGYLCPSRSPL